MGKPELERGAAIARETNNLLQFDTRSSPSLKKLERGREIAISSSLQIQKAKEEIASIIFDVFSPTNQGSKTLEGLTMGDYILGQIQPHLPRFPNGYKQILLLKQIFFVRQQIATTLDEIYPYHLDSDQFELLWAKANLQKIDPEIKNKQNKAEMFRSPYTRQIVALILQQATALAREEGLRKGIWFSRHIQKANEIVQKVWQEDIAKHKKRGVVEQKREIKSNQAWLESLGVEVDAEKTSTSELWETLKILQSVKQFNPKLLDAISDGSQSIDEAWKETLYDRMRDRNSKSKSSEPKNSNKVVRLQSWQADKALEQEAETYAQAVLLQRIGDAISKDPSLIREFDMSPILYESSNGQRKVVDPVEVFRQAGVSDDDLKIVEKFAEQEIRKEINDVV